ncbi:MAG TPA: AAA family ATPase [Armatimonadota bacterium]|nr:AAA family ATPase [Armatimonadota bacterium]
MNIDERIKQRLIETRDDLLAKGTLPAKDTLRKYYATFREHFGPDVLRNTDGEALLELMHGRSAKDNMMYWLEFKDDDEFPAIFGSIAGGSALKFGIFQRKETGAWVTGMPQAQRDIPTADAVAYTSRQRDQLLAGISLLEKLPSSGTDEGYRWLQEQMDLLAPDVSNSAWGHKYFSLLFSDQLDDFHNPDLQRFHLIELLQLPPAGPGRYLVAGRYVAIAHELGMSLNHLTTAINQINRTPYRYWRVGTTDGGSSSYWGIMRDKDIVAVGWPEIGDLSHLTYNQASKDQLRGLMSTHYPSTPQAIGRNTQQLFSFVTAVKDGDIVLAADGMKLLGIGKVIGGYGYDASMDFPHYHPVEWQALGEFKLPEAKEGLRTTLYEVIKPENQLEIQRILHDPPESAPVPHGRPANLEQPLPRLEGWPGRIQIILERKGQVILYGPPGTGKTFWAERTARELAARAKYHKTFDQLSADERGYLQQHLVRLCTFHPAYGYEDFLEGYRPALVDNRMSFIPRDGIFKRLCLEAAQHSTEQYFLIIDEINRGDIPRIFGELLTVLEKNKRGTAVTLPLSCETFVVPTNIFLIGTMNTADRSIALLDAALRRRFGFLELMPDSTVFGNAAVDGISLGAWLNALNARIRGHIGRDARNLQIGHSYFLDHQGRPIAEMAILARVIREDIIPLLEEYCYEDYGALTDILGSNLVDRDRQSVREELFLPSRFEDLRHALLASFAEMTTSPEAIAADAEAPVQEELPETDETAGDTSEGASTL